MITNSEEQISEDFHQDPRLPKSGTATMACYLVTRMLAYWSPKHKSQKGLGIANVAKLGG